MKKVVYVSGTRADFGLMRSCLQSLDKELEIELKVIATGMHLNVEFGDTVNDIVDSGLEILARVNSCPDSRTRQNMCVEFSKQMTGISEALESYQPDLLIVLGDRGEMLAASICAMYLGIPIIHIHGGERSGTVDESIRHAISKIAHYHFVSTSQAKERLIRMGEKGDSVFVTGAPGLDDIIQSEISSKEKLVSQLHINPGQPFFLLVFHPVVQNAEVSGEEFATVLSAVLAKNIQTVVLLPNSDAGSDQIANVINAHKDNELLHVFAHLQRHDYLSAVAHCDVLIGNSSSGIIEAASFSTPVVNIGERQNLRERNKNVIDVAVNREQIVNALEGLMGTKKGCEALGENIYGDGTAGGQIVQLIKGLKTNHETLKKCNTY